MSIWLESMGSVVWSYRNPGLGSTMKKLFCPPPPPPQTHNLPIGAAPDAFTSVPLHALHTSETQVRSSAQVCIPG